eukprot:CAMPEP_0179485540 /NCGR_PEP_ID=MMETSP0799-20121207/62106_1 /TAXON_ID=46947 /ORGANISM="Geminigera cryophila, Strain CCMP2564" /LENGTH=85 /DNA_ID=CAMNT_0021299925 /DNA_START=162 /DNA_END=416 /DNA_ORIENTATION=-
MTASESRPPCPASTPRQPCPEVTPPLPLAQPGLDTSKTPHSCARTATALTCRAYRLPMTNVAGFSWFNLQSFDASTAPNAATKAI